MALRRDDQYILRALEEINRGVPAPARPSPVAAAPEPAAPPALTREEIEATRRRRALARTSETEKAFNLGVSGVHSGLLATRGLARNLIGGSGDEDLMRAIEIQERAAAEGPRIQQVEDIGGVGDALAYARNMVVQQVPNLATMAATGGATGLATRGAAAYGRRRALRGLGEELAERRAHLTARQQALEEARNLARRRKKKMPTELPDVPRPTDIPADVLQRSMRSVNRIAGPARPAGEAAMRVGTALGGTSLQAGQMAEAALDDTQGGSDFERSLKAATGALVTGTIEAMPLMGLLRRYGLAPAEQAAKNVFSGDLLTRMAKAAGVQAGSEGLTELVQTAGELATHKWINNNVELLDDDALSAYINAVVGGAIGGAAFGAPAGFRSADRDKPSVVEGLGRGWDKVQDALRPRPRDTEGEPVRPDAPTDTSYVSQAREVAQAATQGAKTVYEGFKEGLKEGWTANSAFSSEVLDGLDASPFDFTLADGDAVLTGAPLRTFVNEARAADLSERMQLPREQAMFASPIESDAEVNRLAAVGAFDVAWKAFTGWDLDKLSGGEKAALRAYRDALPDTQRKQMNRTLATIASMGEQGILERNEDGSLSEAYLYRPESAGPLATSSESEETQQRAAEQAERAEAGIFEEAPQVRQNVARAARGAPVRGSSASAITMTDAQGQRRIVNMGGAIQELRKDPAFVASIQELPAARRTETEVLAALSYLAEAGMQVDVDSIRSGVALDSEGNWKLTKPAVLRIRAGLGDPQAAQIMADRARPRAPRSSVTNAPVRVEEVRRHKGKARRTGWEVNTVVTPTVERDLRSGRLREAPQDRQPIPDGQLDRLELIEDSKPTPVDEPFIERAPYLPGHGSPGTSTRLSQRPASRPGTREQGLGTVEEVAASTAAAMGVRIDPEGGYVALDGRELRPSEVQAIDDAIAQAEAQFGRVERLPATPSARPADNARSREVERGRKSVGDTRALDSGVVDREEQRAERRGLRDTTAPPLSVQRKIRDKVEARRSTPNPARRPSLGQQRAKAQVRAGGRVAVAKDPPADRLGVFRSATGGNVVSLAERRSRKLQEQARKLLAELSPEDLDTLMNDRMAPPRGKDRSILPSAYKETFQEWLSDSERGESAMAPENQVETETAFLEEVVEGAWEVAPHLRAGAANILANGSMTGPLTFSNATAAKALRSFFKQRRSGAASAPAARTPLGGLDFMAALAKLMGSDAGVERLVSELPRVRSRVTLFAIAEAIRPERMAANPRRYDRAMTAVYKRMGQLTRQIGDAAWQQVGRLHAGEDSDRTISFDQFRGQHAAVVGLKTDSLEDALRTLRARMTPQQKRVVDALLKSGAIRGTKLEIKESAGGGWTGGQYDPGGDKVTIPLASPLDVEDFTNDIFGVFVHEAIHAATMFAELKNAQARKDLNALLMHVRDELEARGFNPDEWYGLSDTQEFLAEAFSNPLFQEILENAPALNTTTFRNAWEQFKGWVKKLLGLTSAQATALDEILAVGRLMMEQQGAIRLQVKGEIWATGPGGVFNSAHNKNPADLLKYLSPEDRARLLEAFTAPAARARIREFVPEDRRHLLDAVDTSAEMLLNWGVGLTLDGHLDISAQDRSAVGRLWDVISKFLRIPSANVYAQQILKDLRAGDIKPKYKADEKLLGPRALAATRWVNRRVVPVTDALLKNMNTRMRETGIPAMRELATLLAQRTGEFRADRQNSLRHNWTRERDRYMNRLHSILGGIDEETNEQLARALQTRDRPKGDVGKLYDQVRKYLDDMYDYMTKAGIDLGKRDEYYPVVMDRDALAANKEEFFALHREFEPQIRERFERWTQDKIDALPKHPKTKKERAELRRLENIYDGIRKRDIDELIGELYDMAQYGSRTHYMPGVDFTHPGHKPAFKHSRHMTSDFIFEHGSLEQKERFAKFQSTNVAGVLAGYTNRATRRAEWERLDLTAEINRLFTVAREQGATSKHLQMMQDYVNMEMGTYNDDWNPVVKRLMTGVDRMFDTRLAETDFQKAKGVIGALQTYNNVRLLPLALLSSLVDPIAISIRSGTARGALSNLREGLRAYRNKEGADALRAMAEQMGIVEREGLSDLTAALYGNIYDPDSRTAKINSWVFRLNGMDAMLRFTRLSALAAGHRFLIRHKTRPNDQSERYLRELGLTPAMIHVSENGQFVTMTPQIESALRRFVEEATVRPTPGHKPSWHNDPNFSLAAQYKGYLYAFYETVLKRAGLELGQGNPAVLVPLMAYIPVTMMAEMTRDLLQGDGDDREVEDYLALSVDRSGLLGPRVGMLDETSKNVKYGSAVTGTLGGATGQQIGDAYSVLSGSGSFGRFFEEALPAQALYKNWGDD